MTAERPPLTFREIDPDDDETLDAFLTTTGIVYSAPWVHTPARRDAARRRMRGHRLTAPFDGERLVGTYRSWLWQLTVPGGGTVTAEAVSSVTVLPTHHRRGALTGLITADLALARTRGAVAAVLVASEATIYGRFGFGPATQTATWVLDVRRARVSPGVPRGGTLEIVSLVDLRRDAPEIFEMARAPGATDRSPIWWDGAFGLVVPPGESPGPRAGVVHRDEDGIPQHCPLLKVD